MSSGNWRQKSLVTLCTTIAAALAASPVAAEIHFTDVTEKAGITYVGPSWGASWGDFNGDGLPDLFTSNHKEPGKLYLNTGSGFADVSADMLPPMSRDTHGAAWADFDNDGDQDLMLLADGGTIFEPNSFYVNDAGKGFIDEAEAFGLAVPEMRARTPVWFDYDRDGKLDLLATGTVWSAAEGTFNILFRQDQPSFTNVNQQTGINALPTLHFAVLSDLTGDGFMELLTRSSTFPHTIHDLSRLPFGLLAVVPPLAGVVDAAIGDFNGDLRPDVYAVHGSVANQAMQIDDNLIEAHLDIVDVEVGLDIFVEGDLDLGFFPKWRFSINELPVLAGAGGIELSPFNRIELSSDNPDYWGAYPYTPGADTGVFISYDPDAAVWSIRISGIGFPLNVDARSSTTISGFEAIGFDNSAIPKSDKLLLSGASGYADSSVASGVASPSWGRAVATADFDNDMDLDIYINATNQTRNRDNLLYENDGNGVFTLVAGSGGAAGPEQGHGDAIALADYDLDGYIDIFVTNGKSQPPWDQDGPVRLFRNTGGSNNWLELDLRGSISNRDGIGATVFLTADGKTQVREQNGGMHHRAQNHQRVHFGLAENESVDLLEIRWPSGAMQTLADLPVNMILVVEEPSPRPCEDPTASSKPGTSGPIGLHPADCVYEVPPPSERPSPVLAPRSGR